MECFCNRPQRRKDISSMDPKYEEIFRTCGGQSVRHAAIFPKNQLKKKKKRFKSEEVKEVVERKARVMVTVE